MARGNHRRAVEKTTDKRSEANQQPNEGNASGAMVATNLMASLTIADVARGTYSKVDLGAVADELRQQCVAVNRGDITRVESLLMSQAMTLDILFQDLARRAVTNRHRPDAFERLLRLGLKAQSQSRATLETLANIKQPPLVVARQANVTQGPQQINNGCVHARGNSNQGNKLLEAEYGERLDCGAACASGDVDQVMATVGAIDRAANT
jgi:hypothetical protein